MRSGLLADPQQVRVTVANTPVQQFPMMPPYFEDFLEPGGSENEAGGVNACLTMGRLYFKSTALAQTEYFSPVVQFGSLQWWLDPRLCWGHPS
jgi:hypothetical protein